MSTSTSTPSGKTVPQTGRDALSAGITFYQTMSRLMLERFPATESVVFYIGTMNAGDVRNAVPRECVIKGTSRSLTRENWKKINDLIRHVALKTAEMHDLDSAVTLHSTYDPVVNSQALYDDLVSNLPVGIEHREAAVTMTGEDFGFFTTRYDDRNDQSKWPSNFIFLEMVSFNTNGG